MHLLAPPALLEVWERGQRQDPVRRILSLLAVAFPDTPLEELASWSIGKRDACLLDLQERVFGEPIERVADCPACGEQVEFQLTASDIKVDAEPKKMPREADVDGFTIRFRLVDSHDLLHAASAPDDESAKRLLLQRCVIEARRDGQCVDPATLSEKAVEALGERVAASDPQAEVFLRLVCVECDHVWRAQFDIATHLWSEIRRAAITLLRDVHALASAYHWNESSILAMSPERRRLYLEMVEA